MKERNERRDIDRKKEGAKSQAFSLDLVDCRGKEKLTIVRRGGDLALEVYDFRGNAEFMIWFRLKRPAKKHYDKVVEIIRSIKEHLIEQNPEAYAFEYFGLSPVDASLLIQKTGEKR